MSRRSSIKAGKPPNPKSSPGEGSIEARAFDVLFEFISKGAEDRLAEANSPEAVQHYIQYTRIRMDYDAALAEGNLAVMVQLTADEELRAEVLAGLVKRRGRPRGSGNRAYNRNAERARQALRYLRENWTRTTKGPYDRQTALTLVQAFFERYISAPLPGGWEKQH